MSRVRADIYTNSTADGPPSLPNGVSITGVTTTSSIVVGAAHTIDSQGVRIAGIVTASSFIGDGSNLTGVSAGLSSARVYVFNQLFS
jgi:hypothetical protein